MSKLLRILIMLVGLVAIYAASSVSLGVLENAFGAEDSENFERNVDEAAISAQDGAIRDLKQLLASHRGTAKEPLFLFKLAIIQQQAGAMKFRVAHGRSQRSRQALDLTEYKREMARSAGTLSELLRKFPRHEQVASATYMRGYAYEEVGDRRRATQDYLRLVRSYPAAGECVSAYMSLAAFSTDKRDHATALRYLQEVERRPADSHYPHALYKMAWSYFNQGQTPTALAYLAKLTRLYPDPSKLNPTALAVREAALMDSALFFEAAHQGHLAGYSAPEALAYFHKLDTAENDEELGKMINKYGKLLRAHDDREEYKAWKNLLLNKELKRPETIETLLSVYEYQKNKQDFADLMVTATELSKHHGRMSDEQKAEAEKLLADTATSLQSKMREYQGTTRIPAISAQIASVYKAFTDVVDDDDKRVAGIHANLAETLFSIKEYGQATEHYRWIIANGSWGDQNVRDASMKAIAARYEELRMAKLVPGELRAVALPKSDPDKIDKRVKEWIDWIDTHIDHTGHAAAKGIEHFEFEASRVLYAAGEIRYAVKRLKSFAIANPKSSLALPSATLVLDTTIAGGRWDEVVSLADDFVGVREWKGSPFAKRVYVIASDAQYKRTETLAQQKKPEEAIEQADVLLSKYPDSGRVDDALTTAANSALSLNKRAAAIAYLQKLYAHGGKRNGKVLLTLAKIEEDRYGFAEAAKYYETYVAQNGGNSAMRKRILSLTWLGGDLSHLNALSTSKAYCSRELAADCARYQALLGEKASAKTATKLAQGRGNAEVRTIWAVTALSHARELGFLARHRMIDVAATGWTKLDPLVKFALLPGVSKSLAESFALDREFIARSQKLGSNEKAITRRIALLREMEASAATASRIPSPRASAFALHDLAGAYDDLATGLRAIPAPKGLRSRDRRAYDQMVAKLTQPYEQKARQVRAKEFQVTSHALVAKSLGVSDLDWDTASFDTGKADEIFRTRWAKALSSGNWPQVGYFLAQAEKKSFLSKSELNTAKAVSFSLAGTQPVREGS